MSNFLSGRKNARLNQPTEFGNLSEKTARLYIIELVQINNLAVQDESSIVILSKCFFYDLMDLDELSQNYDTVNHREGPMTNRALLGLNNYLDNINGNSIQIFDRTNPLLSLLSSNLGVNNYVLSVHFLAHGQAEITKKNLEFCHKLSLIPSFPILNEGNALKIMSLLRQGNKGHISNISTVNGNFNTNNSQRNMNNSQISKRRTNYMDNNDLVIK